MAEKVTDNAAAELEALKAREAMIQSKMAAGLSRAKAEASINNQIAYDKAEKARKDAEKAVTKK